MDLKNGFTPTNMTYRVTPKEHQQQ